MGPHDITCHLTEVIYPALTLTGWPVLDLPTPEGLKAELT